MKELNLKESKSIFGGTSDFGSWLIGKIGDYFCSCKKKNNSTTSSRIYGPTGLYYPNY
ncbi:hypothetical protein [Fontibacter flavus]|uniref:Bacteriocin-type signal sequence-containing protein n=1 Tax=Fontibacter flavus TaxID=654838 RepID=A0ABV6FXR4_9BACT